MSDAAEVVTDDLVIQDIIQAAEARRIQIASQARAIHAERRAARYFLRAGLVKVWNTWRERWVELREEVRQRFALERTVRHLLHAQLARAMTHTTSRGSRVRYTHGYRPTANRIHNAHIRDTKRCI